ncbi:hypothetical protein [Yinghuangia soli]|uniref:Uncharacterized protein n=1 Tax=Yinghuangia soli TaxID=2908204 RepID=A0AA41PX19_9ACTN|nr:hypothetical protein [Yinghuangia soli]MCF2527152.1 hypothetical protein [Yinghuangia soli]
MTHPTDHPANQAVEHEQFVRRIDKEFADVLRRLDDLARRTDGRFAALEARAAALAAHVDARTAWILGRLPPGTPPPPTAPPRPVTAAPPRPATATRTGAWARAGRQHQPA